MTFKAFGITALTFFALVTGPAIVAQTADETDRLQNLESLSETLAIAKRLNAPIILLIEQRHCAFCQRLKREVFRPLANDPMYFDRVLFASVLIDYDGPLIEKNGNNISGFEFSQSFDASTTPTVLFLDDASNELTRIVGYIGGDEYKNKFISNIEKSIQITSTDITDRLPLARIQQ